MQDRHFKRKTYFEEQAYTTEKYVIPYIEEVIPVKEGLRVLEIGCGEGGNLLPFLARGCIATGVDILESKIRNANEFYSGHPARENIRFLCRDIYRAGEDLKYTYQLILIRDVLEHIHDHNKFMGFIQSLLSPGGIIFFGFPPWQYPFGGHQQMCSSKILSKLPWLHLLPGRLYPVVLKLGGEKEGTVADLLEIRQTRITVEGFRRLLRENNYSVKRELFYFINPNYEIKFGLRPRKQIKLLSSIPWLRNFFITTCYYLVK